MTREHRLDPVRLSTILPGCKTLYLHNRCGGRERQTRRTAKPLYHLQHPVRLDRLQVIQRHDTHVLVASEADFPSPRSDGPISRLVSGVVRPSFLPRVVTVQKVDPFEAKMKISGLSFPRVDPPVA